MAAPTQRKRLRTVEARALALRLLAANFSDREVAEIVGRNLRTIRYWKASMRDRMVEA